eukprot:1152919-Pelagomonas_calceolata.AAC.3
MVWQIHDKGTRDAVEHDVSGEHRSRWSLSGEILMLPLPSFNMHSPLVCSCDDYVYVMIEVTWLY